MAASSNQREMYQPEPHRWRFFLGTVEIAGYYRGLAAGLRSIGCRADFASFHRHPFMYGADDEPASPAPIRWARSTSLRYSDARNGPMPIRLAWLWIAGACRVLLFVWAVVQYNVFVFGYGSSILPLPELELRLLRLLRRRVICVFHGTDSRPPYLNGPASELQAAGVEALVRAARIIRQRVLMADRLAHCVVESPSCAHFHERPCVNSFYVGLPLEIHRESTVAPRAGCTGYVRVLHSPSHPEGKGTAAIVRAVDQVRSRGIDIDLVLISGRPNAEVLEEIRRCDFVIDQLYSDTPMAAFAAEAAFFGRPAIVGGYAGELFRNWIPDEFRPPTLYCRPEQLEDAIEYLATDAEARAELGSRAQQFVLERCAPRDFAQRFLHLAAGPPQQWLFDPGLVVYGHGWGLSEPQLRGILRRIVDEYGSGALCVADKPELERLFLDMAAPATCAN